MKRAIYTIILGDYDEIVPPNFIDVDIDYFCITDTEQNLPAPWQKVPFKRPPDQSYHYAQRALKIFGHPCLYGYDTVLYHDGYLHQQITLSPFFDLFQKFDIDLITMSHPDRNCIYDEIQACKRLRKASFMSLEKQKNDYKSEEIPAGNGLIASGFLIRNFQSSTWQKREGSFAHNWYNELVKYNHRDQIAFAAVEYRTPIKKLLTTWHFVIGKSFKKVPHKIKKLY